MFNRVFWKMLSSFIDQLLNYRSQMVTAGQASSDLFFFSIIVFFQLCSYQLTKYMV